MVWANSELIKVRIKRVDAMRSAEYSDSGKGKKILPTEDLNDIDTSVFQMASREQAKKVGA